MTTSTIIGADARERFSELLEQHRGIVLKVAHTYCRAPWDRGDLAQEIVMHLWSAFPSFDPQRRFSTWMYRVALNVAISYVRNTSVRARHSVPFDEAVHDTAAHDSADHDETEQRALLHQFIDELDALDRALLLLYLDELSYQEIADVLGITETNVATKISRLKKRFGRYAGAN